MGLCVIVVHIHHHEFVVTNFAHFAFVYKVYLECWAGIYCWLLRTPERAVFMQALFAESVAAEFAVLLYMLGLEFLITKVALQWLNCFSNRSLQLEDVITELEVYMLGPYLNFVFVLFELSWQHLQDVFIFFKDLRQNLLTVHRCDHLLVACVNRVSDLLNRWPWIWPLLNLRVMSLNVSLWNVFRSLWQH